MENKKIYPFKLLDSYTYEDKEIFFGRDQEIEELYKMTFQNDIILVCGPSGSGKSSLLQCGLANKFNTYDWLALNVRRGENLNDSLLKTIHDKLSEEYKTYDDKEDKRSDLVKKLDYLYKSYFRPIYIILDQFEELYTIGNSDEEETFIKNCKEILATDLPIKLIFSIREEYLGHLFDFEKEIPDLLRKKLRVEPMNLNKVKSFFKGIQDLPNSIVTIDTSDIENLAEKIFKKIKDTQNTRSIELPYLQVFLHQFYLESGGNTELSEEVVLCEDKLGKVGDLKDILRGFIDEKVNEIAKERGKTTDIIWKILSPFATLEGTKKPLSIAELNDTLKDLDNGFIEQVIDSFTNSRILKLSERTEQYEVIHDVLALQIHKRRSDEEITKLEIQRLIKSQVYPDLDKREYFTEQQLLFIEPYQDEIPLDEHQKEWIDKSITHREKKKKEKEDEQLKKIEDAQKQAEREKKLAEKAKQSEEKAKKSESIAKQRIKYVMVALFFALISTTAAVYFLLDSKEQTINAQEAKERAEKHAKIAKEAKKEAVEQTLKAITNLLQGYSSDSLRLSSEIKAKISKVGDLEKRQADKVDINKVKKQLDSTILQLNIIKIQIEETKDKINRFEKNK